MRLLELPITYPLMILSRDTIDQYLQWLGQARNEGATTIIDKEQGWTSFDVVAKLRNLTGVKKVGHAGTLDPLATGLLIVCFGKATKQISDFQDQRKKYKAQIRLGATTKTDDAEADEEDLHPFDHLSMDLIQSAISVFIGRISQLPPMFSAKKIGGVRLYSLARKGRQVELNPSEVEIYCINIINCELPFLTIDVECSKGTYIRSLARDLGLRLGVGGYLAGLRRTAIGNYGVEDALEIGQVIEANKSIR